MTDMSDALLEGMQALLELAGVPATVARITARAVPKIIRIVTAAVEGNRHADEELDALLDAVEASALAHEAAKFGKGP